MERTPDVAPRRNLPMVPGRKVALPRVYGDTPTFLGVPRLDLRAPPRDAPDAVVVGVPWEGTVTWGSFTGCELAHRLQDQTEGLAARVEDGAHVERAHASDARRLQRGGEGDGFLHGILHAARRACAGPRAKGVQACGLPIRTRQVSGPCSRYSHSKAPGRVAENW